MQLSGRLYGQGHGLRGWTDVRAGGVGGQVRWCGAGAWLT